MAPEVSAENSEVRCEQVVDKPPVDASHISLPSLATHSGDNIPEIYLASGNAKSVKRRAGFGEKDVFVVDSVLSREECHTLLQQAEKIGFSFWDTTGAANRNFRSAYTFEVHHPRLAKIIWERVRHQVISMIDIPDDEDDPKHELELVGEWEACGINEHLLFGKYFEGNHFGPHTDGCVVRDLNLRSLCTALLYLSDCPEGGETIIYHEAQKSQKHDVDPYGRLVGAPSNYAHVVQPAVGSFLCFYHLKMHEGAPVGRSNTKYIIRTDVMYRRKAPILTSLNDREAYRLWTRAQVLAEKGDTNTAMQMFQKCFRLSPGLKELLRM